MKNKKVYRDVRIGDLVQTDAGGIGLIVEISCAVNLGRLKRVFIDPNVYHVLIENECITLIREGFRII